MALTFQNSETDIMKAEFLPGARDGATLEQHQPGDCRGVFIRKLPSKCPVQITNGNTTINNPRPVRLGSQAGKINIVFIVNIANNLFQNIFQRHDTAQIAIFIDDNGEMFPPLAESLKLVKQQRCLRDEIRVAGDILDKLAPAIATNTAAAMLANSAQQILDVKNANNVVRVCLLYTSPSPRDLSTSRMPSSA